MNYVQDVTEEELGGRIGSSSLALVEFGAKWCAPCKSLLPILEDLGQLLEGKVSVWKVDVDEAPGAASAHGIMSMPTVIVFKDGAPVERLVGLRPRGAYEAVLSRYLEA